MSLCVEAGELMEHFLWLTPEESAKLPPETRAKVADEIGDVMICLAQVADSLGIDPVEAAREKLRKTAEKYPVDKARGKALKYTAYQKQKAQGRARR